MKLRLPRFSMRFLLGLMLVLGASFGVVGREIYSLRAGMMQREEIVGRLRACGASLECRPRPPRSVLETAVCKFLPDLRPQSIRVSLPAGTGPYPEQELDRLAELEGVTFLFDFGGYFSDQNVRALAKNRSLFAVSLGHYRGSSESLSALATGEGQIHHLHLYDVAVDDAFLRAAAMSKSLTSLEISGEGITSAGLASLSKSATLVGFHLSGGENLGEGLAQLAQHSKLKSLSLDYVVLKAEDFDVLPRFRFLEWLHFRSGEIPAEFLPAAARMPNLRILELKGRLQWTPESGPLKFACLQTFFLEDREGSSQGLISELSKSPLLDSIKIPSAVATAEDLKALARLPRLDYLTVHQSPSREAIEELQRAQPYCIYVDSQWGLLQPRIGINPNRMGTRIKW